MQRYAVWLISALVALVVFAAARAAGVGEVLVLVLAAIGAIVGSVLGTLLMQRVSADAARSPERPPGQGSGKTKA